MEMRRWTLMRVKRKKERRKRLNAQQAAESHEAAVGKRRLTNKPQSPIEVFTLVRRGLEEEKKKKKKKSTVRIMKELN